MGLLRAFPACPRVSPRPPSDLESFQPRVDSLRSSAFESRPGPARIRDPHPDESVSFSSVGLRCDSNACRWAEWSMKMG